MCERCDRLAVRFQDLSGAWLEAEYTGDGAADVQHGVDHLDGRMYFDRQMTYLIPNEVYRQFKQKGTNVLNAYVADNYRPFDRDQNLSDAEMIRVGVTHPRQSIPRLQGDA